jgi:hypothetical protein
VSGNLFVYFLDHYRIRFELFYELKRAYPYNREPVIREAVDRTHSINVCSLQPRKHTGRAYNLACSKVQVGVFCYSTFLTEETLSCIAQPDGRKGLTW